MIKVGLLIGQLGGGGAERVVLELLKHLDRDQFQPFLILYKKEGVYLSQVPNDVVIIEMGDYSRFIDIFDYSKIMQGIINDNSLDIIISHQTYINTKLLRSHYIKKINIPILISEHSNFERRYDNKNYIETILYKYYIKHLYKRADKIITCSNGVASSLKKSIGLTKFKKFKVIYNPVNYNEIEEKSKSQPKFINSKHLEKGQKSVVAVGRLDHPKGYFNLLKSVSMVKNEINFKLFIIGQGTLEKKLKQYSKDLDIEERVCFTGFLQNPWSEIARADLFVLSSLWEGFGNVIIESMASGTAVLSVDCDYGPSEIIDNNIDGKLIENHNTELLANSIINLLQDDEERTKYKLNAKNKMKKFSTNKFISLYQDIIYDSVGHYRNKSRILI